MITARLDNTFCIAFSKNFATELLLGKGPRSHSNGIVHSEIKKESGTPKVSNSSPNKYSRPRQHDSGNSDITDIDR